MTNVDPGCSLSAEFKGGHKCSFSQIIVATKINYHVFLKACVSEILYYYTLFFPEVHEHTPNLVVMNCDTSWLVSHDWLIPMELYSIMSWYYHNSSY